MIFAASVNPNAIDVPLIQNGCLESEFDSTYPIHLNGIIGQDEFQQSIRNINQTISSRTYLIFIICVGCGRIFLIVGGITTAAFGTHESPILVGIGFGLFILGMLCLLCEYFIIQLRRTIRMQQAVANESMKYSTRSPTPCSWRLYVSRTRGGGYGYRRSTRVIYRLVIEVGQSVLPGNGNVPHEAAPPSAPFFPQQDYTSPPPPYYDQSAAGFRSHCGILGQNITTEFCSTCDQPYNT